MRAKLSLAFLAVFCAAMVAAALRYPGGSWLHPHAVGFSVAENFWCDLMRQPAHNGAPNGAVVLGTVGFAALGLALWPFWLEVSRLLPPPRSRFVRGAGGVSALGTAFVALMPSDRFPHWHGPVVLTAGGLGFICGISCAGFAVRAWRKAPLFAATSLFLLLCASLNLVLYVWVAYLRGPETVVLPVAQKLATLGLLAWMAAGLRASARLPKP